MATCLGGRAGRTQAWARAGEKEEVSSVGSSDASLEVSGLTPLSTSNCTPGHRGLKTCSRPHSGTPVSRFLLRASDSPVRGRDLGRGQWKGPGCVSASLESRPLKPPESTWPVFVG